MVFFFGHFHLYFDRHTQSLDCTHFKRLPHNIIFLHKLREINSHKQTGTHAAHATVKMSFSRACTHRHGMRDEGREESRSCSRHAKQPETSKDGDGEIDRQTDGQTDRQTDSDTCT